MSGGGESLIPQKLSLKTRLQLRILSLITYYAARSDVTVNRRLMNFLDRKTPSNPIPVKGVATHDVTVDSERDLWFRLFVPTDSSSFDNNNNRQHRPLPLVVFFHGGGFVFLSAGSFAYDAVCRRFARRLGAVVVSVNYRLAPEHKFPAQYDDAFDVLRFLDEQSSSSDKEQQIENNFNLLKAVDVSRCFLIGDSAGGNIAHHTAVRASSSSSSSSDTAVLKKLRVIGTVAIQPFFGGDERLDSEIRLEGAPIVSTDRTDWMWKAFSTEGMGPDHWARNVCGPNAMDLSGLHYFPPTLLVVGGFDPLRDWQLRYYHWLKNTCGKEVKLLDYPQACHAFYVFPEVPEASELIAEIKAFMDQRILHVGLPQRRVLDLINS